MYGDMEARLLVVRMLQYTLGWVKMLYHMKHTNAINQTNIFLNVHPQTDFEVIMILKLLKGEIPWLILRGLLSIQILSLALLFKRETESINFTVEWFINIHLNRYIKVIRMVWTGTT